ncbi:MAG: hypothetical protein HYY18_10540 [Planctomycetes bacterium]|nr:hypothetical protein [Planctomycetota bacterium]
MKHTLTSLALALAAGIAFGDTVTTTDGRRLEGKVKDLGNEILLEGKYGSTRIRKTQIEKIEYGATGREQYAEKSKALKPDDLAGHWSLAKWCKANGLEAEYRKEARIVVDLDPKHEEARLALGHKLVEGEWLSEEDIHLANGEVKRDGHWVTQNEAERIDQEEKARELLRAASTKDAEKNKLAIQELVKLRDDALLGPCSRAVSNSSPEMRAAAWQGLARAFETTKNRLGFVTDLQARFDKLGDLTQVALREKNDEVRKFAVDATRAMGDEYARMWYQKLVVEEEGQPKLRAAEVLGEMNSPASVPYMMMAFYTVYIEVRATNAMAVQDITDSFVDFIADPERRVITQPLRIETPKLAIQRVKTTGVIPEGFHSQASNLFGAVLNKMTGEEYGDDFESWNKWYQTNGKTWVKEKVAEMKKAKEEGK